MGILNGNWKVYTDPEWAVGKKRATEENRRLSGLNWSDESVLVTRHIDTEKKIQSWKWATVEEVSDPEYDPWIYTTAKKVWNKDDPKILEEHRGGYEFLCQPSTGTVYYRRLNADGSRSSVEFNKLKSGRKIHKSLLERIGEIKAKIRKSPSPSSAGYINAPYIPIMKKPTFLDPNSFTPNKRILTRYGKKLVSPKYYGVVTVKTL
jgi:hypothetical protein